MDLVRAAAVGTLLCAVAPPARAGDETFRVSLIVIYDDTARAPIAKLRRALSRSVTRHPQLELVNHAPALEAANEQRISVGRWLDSDVLPKITKGMELDAVLGARVSRQKRRYEITLLAVSPVNASPLWETSLRVKKPRLLAAQADRMVRSVAEKLVARTREVQTEEPAEESWGAGLEFEEIDETTAATQQMVEVGGRVEVEHFSYPVELKEDKVAGRDSVELELSVQATGEKARGYGSLLLRKDFAEPDRNRIDIHEAYAEVNLGSFTMRAGRIIAAWGTASLTNPSDILNPIDFRDPIDPIKHGSWMLRAGVLLGPVSIEAYYLPVPEAHLVPFPDRIDEQNRLVGESRWVKGTLDVPTDLPLRWTLGEQSAPPPSPTNSQAAVRLAASGLGIDFSLAYAYVFDHFPTVRATVTPAAPIPIYADVDVDFEYLRQHVVTADFEAAVGKFRFAGEGAVFLTEDMDDVDSEVDNPYVAAVLGVDYRTSQFWTNQALHFFVDVTLTRALVGELATDDVGRLRYPFQTAALGRVSWEVGDVFQFDVTVVSALDALDILVYPELEYTFYDRVKARLGFTALAGERSGFFGRFRRNSRAVLGVEVKI